MIRMMRDIIEEPQEVADMKALLTAKAPEEKYYGPVRVRKSCQAGKEYKQ